MPNNQQLIKELENIRAEVLPTGSNPFSLSSDESKNCFIVINTLLFIARHIEKLKSNTGTYYPADPGDTGTQQVSKYAPIHLQQARKRAVEAINREVKNTGVTLTKEQKETRIQDAVEHILVVASSQLFIDSFKEVKKHQSKMADAKVTANLVKEFCKKLVGNCIDARIREASDYALTITKGPRFTELFSSVMEEIPIAAKLSYFSIYAALLKKYLGHSFQHDIECKSTPELRNGDGIFAADDVVSGLVRRALTQHLELNPLKPEVVSAKFPNDPSYNIVENPYDHFLLAYQQLDKVELKDHMVKFLLSHEKDFVSEFILGFEKRFLHAKPIQHVATIVDIAIRLGKVDWISACVKENSNKLRQFDNLLQLAADRGDQTVFMTIINAGFPLTAKINKCTPIQIAAYSPSSLFWKCVEDIADILSSNEDDIAYVGAAILHAAKFKQWDLIRKLLKKEPNLTWLAHDMNYSILSYVILGNQAVTQELEQKEKPLPSIAQLLLNANFNINFLRRDRTPHSAPLHVAAKIPTVMPETFQWLLSQPDINLELTDSDGNTPLMLAAQSGQLDKVKALIKWFLTRKRIINLDTKNDQGNSALMLAAANGHIEIVQFLLANGSSAQTIYTSFNKDGKHALDIIAEKGNATAFIALIKMCGDHLDAVLTAQNKQGRTPIQIAAYFSFWDCVEEIVALKHADAQDTMHFGDVLCQAASQKKWDLVIKLVNANAKNDWATHGSGYSAFHHAIDNNLAVTQDIEHKEHKEQSLPSIAQLLKEKARADVNQQFEDKPNPTPLHVACKKTTVNIENFQWLLDQPGIDLERKDYNDNTALMLAAQSGQLDKVKKLVERLLKLRHKVNFDAMNKQGNSALMLAAANGHVEIVQFLIEHGSSAKMIYRLNADDKHALDYLVEKFDSIAFRKLIAICAKDNLDSFLTSKNKENWTPFEIAAYSTFWDCADDIISLQGSDEKNRAHYGHALPFIAYLKQWDLVRKIVNSKAVVNRVLIQYGYSAFHSAIFHNQVFVQHSEQKEHKELSIAQLILNEGEDVNAQAAEFPNPTPLQVASQEPDVKLETLRWLLDQPKTKLELKDSDGDTALMLAAYSNQIDKVRMLLERGAKFNALNKHGDSAVMLAAVYGHDQVVKAFIVDGGAPATLLCAFNNDGKHAFDILAEQGNWSAFTALIGVCEDSLPDILKSINKRELTPVEIAAQAGAWDCVLDILNLASIDKKDEAHWGSVLQMASERGKWNVVRELLKRGVNPTWFSGKTGYYPLHDAILENQVTSQYEQKDEEPSVAKLLLSQGVNVNQESKSPPHNTPLHLAAERRTVELHTLRWLLECKRINVNSTNQQGNTALILAIQAEEIEKVALLLNKPDCDIHSKRMDGKTAFDIAREQKSPEILALFNTPVIKFKIAKNKIDREQYAEASKLLAEIFQNNPEKFREYCLSLQGTLGRVGIDATTAYQKLINHLIPLIIDQIIASNDISTLSLLLKNTRDPIVSAKCRNGETMLQCAAKLNKVEIVSYLLGISKNSEKRDSIEFSALNSAAESQAWSSFEEISDSNKSLTVDAQYLAAKMRRWAYYEKLFLQQHWDSETGFTAFQIALSHNDIETAEAMLTRDPQLLADKKIDLDPREQEEKRPKVTILSPLVFAIRNSSVTPETVNWLLNKVEQSSFKSSVHSFLRDFSKHHRLSSEQAPFRQKKLLHELLLRILNNTIGEKEDTSLLDNRVAVDTALACMAECYEAKEMERVRFVIEEFHNPERQGSYEQYRFFAAEHKSETVKTINYDWYNQVFKLAHSSTNKNHYMMRQKQIRVRALNLFEHNMTSAPDLKQQQVEYAVTQSIFKDHRQRNPLFPSFVVDTVKQLKKL